MSTLTELHPGPPLWWSVSFFTEAFSTPWVGNDHSVFTLFVLLVEDLAVDLAISDEGFADSDGISFGGFVAISFFGLPRVQLSQSNLPGWRIPRPAISLSVILPATLLSAVPGLHTMHMVDEDALMCFDSNVDMTLKQTPLSDLYAGRHV